MPEPKSNWPLFEDITEPRMVCFGTGNGSGSKLFQSYLDNHPQIYMVPGYALLYLYPHWEQWKEELVDEWNWLAIIKEFCVRHASVIDTRQIPATDGMTTLGEKRDQYVKVDEVLFRNFLVHLLKNQPISCRTFLLAVHYSYSFAIGENLSQKKILIYHIHVHEYVPKYLEPDFPDMLTIAFVRDPRSNLKGRYESTVRLDAGKLNRTDATVYKRRTFYYHWIFYTESLECLRGLPSSLVKVVRHEDMHYCLEKLMRATAYFLCIDFHPCLLSSTFGGLLWWGDKVYDMKPLNKPNPRVISLAWKKTLPPLDWFVLEGLFYNYCNKYGYHLYRYKRDTLFNKLLLFFAMFLPSLYELKIFWDYIMPTKFLAFLRASHDEAKDRLMLKDYSFNAYYRHKWSNKGLNIHRPRLYIRFLNFTHDLVRKNTTVLTILLYEFARWNYVLSNIGRYMYCIFVFPLIVIKRGMVSFKAFLRLINHKEVLPERLP